MWQVCTHNGKHTDYEVYNVALNAATTLWNLGLRCQYGQQNNAIRNALLPTYGGNEVATPGSY